MENFNSNSFKKKLEEAVKQYASLGKLAVEVGLPSDRIHEPSGLPLSEVGAVHEFGLNNIPERSFLRGSIRDGEEEIRKNHEIIARKAVKGEDAQTLMEAFSLFGEGLVKDYIHNGNSNFIALAHPRKDGSSNPLNDTGALRQGIIGVVVSDE